VPERPVFAVSGMLRILSGIGRGAKAMPGVTILKARSELQPHWNGAVAHPLDDAWGERRFAAVQLGMGGLTGHPVAGCESSLAGLAWPSRD
jgi:hypothetical protein